MKLESIQKAILKELHEGTAEAIKQMFKGTFVWWIVQPFYNSLRGVTAELLRRIEERKKTANPKFRTEVFNTYGHYCLRHKNELGIMFVWADDIDHVFPVAKGGMTTIANTQPLCHQCNLKKGVITVDYRKTKGIKPINDGWFIKLMRAVFKA